MVINWTSFSVIFCKVTWLIPVALVLRVSTSSLTLIGDCDALVKYDQSNQANDFYGTLRRLCKT